MNIQRKLAVAFLAISVAAPLYAEKKHDNPDRPLDRKPAGGRADEDIAEGGKLKGGAKEKMLEAERQRDRAVRGFEELKRRNEELVKQLEAARSPGDAAPGRERDRRMQHLRQPQQPVRPYQAQLRPPTQPGSEMRHEISAAMRDLSALRAEIGKLREGSQRPGDVEEMRKKIELLGQQKTKAEESAKRLASRLEAEMQARRRLEQQITAGSGAERKLEEATQKLDKANQALTVQLKAISEAKQEAKKAAEQRAVAERSLAQREAEIKRMKEAMAKRNRQPKDGNKEN